MRAFLPVAVLCGLAVSTAHAQEYRWEPVDSLGIKVRVHKKLKPVPIEAGAEKTVNDLHKRARFEPKNRQQFIFKGPNPFNWHLDVWVFEAPKKYRDKPKDPQEVRRRAIEKRKYEAGARNYQHFIRDKQPGASQHNFHGKSGKDGKPFKAKRGLPAGRQWEYSINYETDDSPPIKLRWYTYARSYKFEGREIALSMTWPVFKDKPSAKYLGMAKKMTEAIQITEASAKPASSDAGKDQFANTEVRKATLEQVAAGVRGIDGWDYFTTEAAIVLYSWKPGGDKQKKALKTAKPIAAHFGAMQDLYREKFPPPKEMKETYPVLRICFDRHTMRLYGSPPLRAESFFNANSGEVVIMLGGDHAPNALAAREGWYQYAHTMFRGANVSPWFNHGVGYHFACWQKRGKKWVFAPNKDLIAGNDGAKTVFKKGFAKSVSEFASLRAEAFEETEENEDAEKLHSQAYALFDFLQRGKKLGNKWNEDWGKVVPNYVQAMLKTRNMSRANKASITTIEAKAFDAALSSWVSSHLQKK